MNISDIEVIFRYILIIVIGLTFGAWMKSYSAGLFMSILILTIVHIYFRKE